MECSTGILMIWKEVADKGFMTQSAPRHHSPWQSKFQAYINQPLILTDTVHVKNVGKVPQSADMLICRIVTI